MKKHLLLASLFVTAGLSMSAQTIGRVLTPVTIENPTRPTAGAERNSTCTADTLRYALLKEYALTGATAGYACPLAGPGEEQSQAFISTEAVNVVGVNFRARINSANGTAVVPVMVYLYDVDGTLSPTVAMDSALVTVSGTSSKNYNANFAVPHSVTGNYAVGIRPTLAFQVDFISNTRTAASGGEALSFVKYDAGAGLTWYPNALAWGQDFDALFSPIVTYPIATDYTVSPSSTVCLGTAMSFTNTTTPASNLANRMYNYNTFLEYWGLALADSTTAWDMGDGSAPIWSTNANYTYPAAGTNTVTLYTLAGFWKSCVDTKASTVTINSDDASITTPAAVCEGTSAFNLVAATPGGTWAGTGITDNSMGTFDPTVSGAGTWSVTYLTNGSCPATGSVSVVVNAQPSLTVSNPAAICAPGTVDLTDAAVTSGSTGGGTLSYWTDAATTASVATPAAVGTSGTYYIKAANGTCTDVEPVTVTINPVDDATISDPGMICDDAAPFNLSAATSGGAWTGSGITDGAMGTFDAASVGAGTYTVNYTTAGTCPGTDMISLTVSVCTGVQAHTAAAALSVYPNPSTGMFTLDLGVNEKSSIEVYNVIGSKVIAKEVNSQISTLDMSGFDAGVYFVKVTTGNTKVTKKVTIAK